MAVPARTSLITLGVADLARSVAFYEALGWRQSPASVEGTVAFFPTADSVLALFGHHELAADAGVEAGEPPAGFRGVSLAINVESDDEVREVVDEMVAAGGTLLKEPSMAVFDGLSAYVADPDGHAWEVAHNPHFSLGHDGSVRLPRREP